MKKIILTILLASSFLFVHAQIRLADYQDFMQRKIVNEDSVRMTGKSQDFILFSELFNNGTPLKEIFNGEAYDRTSDNLFFILKPNYYKIYIQEAHILFTVTTNSPDIDISTNFLWLTAELRRFKSESATRLNY